MERSRQWRAGLVAAGAALGLTLAGLGVAGAQTEEQSPEAQAPRPGPAHKGRGGHPGKGALHGEFTTKAPGGGYQTLAVQRGEVTAVSGDSLTVKSEDGFSRTYAVDDGTMVHAGDDGVGDVKVGDKVRVTAVVADGKARAVDVHDATQAKELRGRWAPARGERD